MSVYKIKIFLSTIIIVTAIYICLSYNNQYFPIPLVIELRSPSNPRIYCFVLTSPTYFDTRARAVNFTWLRRCDRYTFISEYSNDTKGLPIAPIPNITAGYGHLTQKSRLALHYIYENFPNDYDWVVKADDDTYLFVDNLKSFLKVQNSTEPVTFGYNFKVIVRNGYHSGGGGYVLSREAVKRFYQESRKPNTTCKTDGGPEDVAIAQCLRHAGVYMGKSVDEQNRERFHPLSFSNHFLGPFPDWLFSYAQNKPLTGSDCCSNTTISFHYVKPELQYLIDKAHYEFRHNA